MTGHLLSCSLQVCGSTRLTQAQPTLAMQKCAAGYAFEALRETSGDKILKSLLELGISPELAWRSFFSDLELPFFPPLD